MEDWDPLTADVVNSFQGAFGPPTRGHYEAMRIATEATIKNHPSGNILMLFMPTAGGSSKPHLFPTQASRIEALELFCTKLKTQFPDQRIKFEPSRLEYELYADPVNKKNTATILTLKKLREVYTKAEISVTMGLDNMFDFAFWAEVTTYGNYTKPSNEERKPMNIYVLKRDTTKEDQQKTFSSDEMKLKLRIVAVEEDKGLIRFNKFASWNFGKALAEKKKRQQNNTISDSVLIESITSTEEFKDTESLNQKLLDKGAAIKTSLENDFSFILMSEAPPPTSSSLLRGALYKYYVEPPNHTYLKPLQVLIGDCFNSDDSENPWFKNLNEMKAAAPSEIKIKDDLEKKSAAFNNDYSMAFGKKGGSRRSRKSNRKNNRKSRKNNRRTRRR